VAGIQDQGASMVYSVECSLLPFHSVLLPSSVPRDRREDEGERESSSYKTPTPRTSSKFNCFLKVQSPYIATLGG
jgi:hypothetical protein